MKQASIDLFRGGFWVYLLSYIMVPAAYFIRMIYARNFSLESFGLFYAVVGFLSLISIFNDLGFTETLSYYGTKFFEKKDYRRCKTSFMYALWLQFLTSLIIGLILFFSADWFATHYFKNPDAVILLKFMVLFFIFSNTTKPLSYIFLSKNDFFNFRLFEVVRMYSLLAAALVLIWRGWFDLVTVALTWSLSIIIGAILYLLLLRKNFSEFNSVKVFFDWPLFKKLFSYALPIVLGSGATILLSRIDVQLLAVLTTLSDVGLYEAAFSLANIFTFLIAPISVVVFPLTAKLTARNEESQINHFMSLLYRFFLFIGVPLAIMLMVFSASLLDIIYGNMYVSASSFLIVLTIALFISVGVGFNFSLMAGLGLARERMKVQYIGAFINIVGDIILILVFGALGAAIATVVTMLFLLLISFWSIRKYFILELSFSYLVKVLLLNAAFLGLLLFLKYQWAPSILIMLIITSVSICAYLVIGWLLSMWRFSYVKSFVNEKFLSLSLIKWLLATEQKLSAKIQLL